MKWCCRGTVFDLSKQGEIMGILNVTPDSFSDGGRYETQATALAQAERMLSEGAAILDVGGESTRPGAEDVPEEEETRRVVPVIAEIRERFPRAAVSVDTSKPAVARRALEAGAHIINDVTGFRDPEMIEAAAEYDAGCVVMHMQGTPRTMQQSPSYENVVREIADFFRERLASMQSAGIAPEAIVFDPGIGFGKSFDHNLALLSRKSFLGKLIDSDAPEERDWPTAAVTSLAVEKGVLLHRVHAVGPNREAMRMTEAMR
jgi:dihydropteroate synthase